MPPKYNFNGLQTLEEENPEEEAQDFWNVQKEDMG